MAIDSDFDQALRTIPTKKLELTGEKLKEFQFNLALARASDFFVAKELNELAQNIHTLNMSWWKDLYTGEPIDRNAAEMLFLVTSELVEGFEGVRKNLMDDKLPHRKMEEVEIADAVIRILDYCAGRNLDIGGALIEKLRYNASREDHTPEHRKGEHGKKF